MSSALLLVALGWMYVVVVMAAAEATGPGGSVVGAIVTLLLYGVLPLAIVLYLMATPARRRLRRAREAAESADAEKPAAPPPPPEPRA
jgi:membrane protein implicated in regulation of membrane protease activity